MCERRLREEKNLLSLAEEIMEVERRESIASLSENSEGSVSGGVVASDKGTPTPSKKPTVKGKSSAGAPPPNSGSKSMSDDLLETLDIVVKLLQSVADQLSLATGKPTGSNVNSLSELNWETAAFEKEIRERLQWIGDKVNCLRFPRFLTQLMDFGREYARENPVTAFILLALCLTSSAPVLMFFVFAVATILVTFLGFLFVEGTLLTVATVIFGGVILVVGFLTLTAVLIGMLGYFTTNQAYQVLTGKSRIFRLLRKFPIIGGLFSEPQDITQSRNSSGVSEEEISKLLNGIANSNGKVGNGHSQVLHHHPRDDLHDEFDDLLDSEVEEEEESSTPVMSSDSEPGLEENGVEEEEDLGNQEVISDVLKVKSRKGAESPSSLADEDHESSSPSTPIHVNGHHEMNGDGMKNGELNSD